MKINENLNFKEQKTSLAALMFMTFLNFQMKIFCELRDGSGSDLFIRIRIRKTVKSYRYRYRYQMSNA